MDKTTGGQPIGGQEDVVIFVHRAFRQIVTEAKDILESQYDTRCSVVSVNLPDEVSWTGNVEVCANSRTARVFIMTAKFIKEDLKHHETLLDDSEKSNEDNTVFVFTGKIEGRILEKFSRFPRVCLDGENTPANIAKKVAKFLKQRNAPSNQQNESNGDKLKSTGTVVNYNFTRNEYKGNIVVAGGNASIQQDGGTYFVASNREPRRKDEIAAKPSHTRDADSGLRDELEENVDKVDEYVDPTESICDEDSLLESQKRDFLKIFGEREDQIKRGYILITSAVRKKYPGLENIVAIPWLRVFDFDSKSRVCGLLSVAEPTLKDFRHFTITDLVDEIESLNDKVTNWVFMNGYSDSAEIRHDEKRPISPQTIVQHSQMLTEHCQAKKVPTILVVWYPTDDQSDFQLYSLLNGINFYLEGSLGKFTCVLCMEREPEAQSELGRTVKCLDSVRKTIIVPLEVLCSWLKSLHSVPERQDSSETLPKFPDDGGDLELVPVLANDLKWIDVCFDLLTIRNDSSNEKKQISDPPEDLDEGVGFLKGDEITWQAIEDGRYDVTRDLLDEAREYVYAKHIKTGKSGVITIFHSPSGGGTAFARRLLWSLRENVPCVELKALQSNMEELKQRLQRIRSITKLPVVMLVDGKSDHDMKKIMEFSRSLTIIAIHLQRYYSAIEGAYRREERFFLPDRVSTNEAENFFEVFSRVAEKKQLSLKRIKLGIMERKEKHFVFEYGLAAFQLEFHGLVRYVHGYLQIQGSEDLKEWQTALGFLSLANYYGSRRGLPCKLFSHLLHKDADEIIYLDDLPHCAEQFITEDKYGNWRITHYVVSLAILEQVLVRRPSTEYEWGHNNSLTADARRNLSAFAIEFITYLSSFFLDPQTVPGDISDILTSIFIKRYYNDPGDGDFMNKSLYSRLLNDAGSDNEKLAVLDALAENFPHNAEFRAHLGRFHYLHRDFAEAEKCLSKAESMRKAELQRRGVRNANYCKGDDVLERICNMFGFCYNAQLKHLLGASIGRLKEEQLRDKRKPTLIQECLKSANSAIKKFGEGRRYYQKGSNPTFSYLGEIRARLHVTELARVLGGNDLSGLRDRTSPYNELKEFAMNSFHECDHLLSQCIYYMAEKDLPEEEVNFCINNFQHFFKGATVALEHYAGEDLTVRSKRCHLSLLKMNLKMPGRFRIYDDIERQSDLIDLVRLYEGIFDSVYKKKDEDVRISNYMLEWLQAIRHKLMPKRYSQADVLTRVEKWNDRKEVGSMATFYRFIVSTLISLSSPRGELANSYSVKSNKYKEMMEHHAIPLHLLDKSIEWLGNTGEGGSFDQLINISSLGDWNGKFWNDVEVPSKLKVCTGRIYTCKAHNGSIIVDGGQKPPISVHFIPQRYNISVSHSKQKTRVEFYVGFNPRHKAEAFKVSILQSYPCPVCKTPTEVKTLGRKPQDCQEICRNCEAVVTPTSY